VSNCNLKFLIISRATLSHSLPTHFTEVDDELLKVSLPPREKEEEDECVEAADVVLCDVVTTQNVHQLQQNLHPIAAARQKLRNLRVKNVFYGVGRGPWGRGRGRRHIGQRSGGVINECGRGDG
jgi:hypothetical protein